MKMLMKLICECEARNKITIQQNKILLYFMISTFRILHRLLHIFEHTCIYKHFFGIHQNSKP